MRLILFLTFSLFNPFVAFNQTISLPGIVVIQNSEYETGKRMYVSDASIRAPFAKASTSDAQGAFILTFQGVGHGMLLRLDVKKPGLEVVNSREIEQVVAGRTVDLIVVMAEPEKLARARVQFHDVAIGQVERAFEVRLNALRDTSRSQADRIATLGAELGDTLSNLGEAMTRLTTQRDQAMVEAARSAEDLALVDLDRASDRYRAAYVLFRSGEVDSALAVMDQAILDREYNRAKDRKDQGAQVVAAANLAIQRTYASYDLKADVLRTTLRYREALEVLFRMGTILDQQRDAFSINDEMALLCERGKLQHNMGHFKDALATYRSAVEIGSKSLPAGYPALTEAHGGVGAALLELGSYAEALPVLLVELGGWASALGNGAAQVGQAHDHVSMAYYYLGQYDSAIVHGNKAAEILAAAPGSNAEAQGRTMSNQANIYMMKGDYNKALQLTQQGLELHRAGLPADHPTIAVDYGTIAEVHRARGEYEEALRANASSLDIMLKTLGPDHPYVASAKMNSALSLLELGRDKEAEAIMREVLEIRLRILGPMHEHVADCYNSLGVVVSMRGELDTGRVYLFRALRIQRAALGPDHLEVANTLNSIAMSYSESAMFDSVPAYYAEAGRIIAGSGGPDHPDLNFIENNIGLAFALQGRYRDAVPHYLEAVRIAQHIPGSELPTLSSNLGNLGNAYQELDRRDSALICFRMGRALSAQFVGEDHVQVGQMETRIAQLMAMDPALSDSAITVVDHGIGIIMAKKGPDHPGTSDAVIAKANVLRDLGRLDEAIVQYRAALAILHRSTVPVGSRLYKAQTSLGRALYERGSLDESYALLDSSFTTQPQAAAAWYLYRIAADKGSDDVALERLVECTRLRAAWPGTTPAVLELTRNTLRDLATRLHRSDVLTEFGLD